MNMSISDLWKRAQCRFCWIGDFLCGVGHIPWLVCLFMLEEDEAFNRSTEFLRSIGEDKERILRWICSVSTDVRNGNVLKDY